LYGSPATEFLFLYLHPAHTMHPNARMQTPIIVSRMSSFLCFECAKSTRVGIIVGDPGVGATVGDVGEAVCALVGEAVCALVGDAVSAFVGEAVCALVGEAVCALVGEAVCALVGDAVSAFVGDAVSTFVGDAVSAFVGDGVSVLVGVSVWSSKTSASSTPIQLFASALYTLSRAWRPLSSVAS